MPDVFVPACLTPGTTGLMVVHNHPSGDPTPSPDDARLTLRLCAAADVLDMPLLDHLIVVGAEDCRRKQQQAIHAIFLRQLRPLL